MSLVHVGPFATEFEAGLAQGLLAQHGIPACLSGGADVPLPGAGAAPAGAVLAIDENDRSRALALLRRARPARRRAQAERRARAERKTFGARFYRLVVTSFLLFGAAVLLLGAVLYFVTLE